MKQWKQLVALIFCLVSLLHNLGQKAFFFLRFKSHPFTFSLPANSPIVEVLNKI